MAPDQDGVAFGKEEPLLGHTDVPGSAASPASYMLWKITRMFSTRTNQKESVAAVAFLDLRVLRTGRAEGRSPSAFVYLPPRLGDIEGVTRAMVGTAHPT